MAYSKRYALGADITATGLNQIAPTSVGDVRALQVAINRFHGAVNSPITAKFAESGVLDNATVERAAAVLIMYANAALVANAPVAPELSQILGTPLMTPEQKSAWIVSRMPLIVGTLNGYADVLGLPGGSSSKAWLWGVAAAGVAIFLFGKRGRR